MLQPTLLICLLCFVTIITITLGANMEIEFDRIKIGNYSESDFADVKSRVRKFNRTTYTLSIEGDVKIPLSDDIACKFSVLCSQGNEFKVIATKQVDKFCTFASQDKIAYEDLQKYSNIPPQGNCPIPANKYVIKDYVYTPNAGYAILRTAKKWNLQIVCKIEERLIGIVNIYFGVK